MLWDTESSSALGFVRTSYSPAAEALAKVARIITTTTYTRTEVIQRCCPTHRDWMSLAQHLVADFGDVPKRSVIDELVRARRAGELFQLARADALDCAELIVRNRVISATGTAHIGSSSVGNAPTAAGKE